LFRTGLNRLLVALMLATLLLPVAPGALASRPSAARDAVTTPGITPTPSATPSRTPTVQPTPAPTKTPPRASPTPAATPRPDSRLVNGRYLQSIGDCAGARREFADLLDGKPVAGDAAEARYRMAQCYLRDAAPAEAAALLSQLLQTAPASDPYRAPANFLLGDALSQLGRWKEAEKSYTTYLPLAPEIKAVTWQRIGAARKADANPLGATQAYSAALESSFDWTNTVAIRRALADLSLERGDYQGAVAHYDALRGKAVNAWGAEMQWLAGSALSKAGDLTGAQRRWQAAVDADPKSSYAHQAMVGLVESGASLDEYQRGVVDYYNGLYQLAIEAFARLRTADPTGRQGAAWYFTALSYLALGQTDKGLAELGNLIAAYPKSPYWADAWLAKGRAQADAGKRDDAIATYRELARVSPDAPQAPKALWRAAALLTEAGRTAEATEQYLALGRRYPAADEGWRGYQAAGLNYFRQSDWRRAGETWDEMARAALPTATRPAAYFWLGRAQAAAGEVEAAQRSWKAAIDSGPGSYYALRAAEWSSKKAAPGAGGAVSGTSTPTAQLPARLATPAQEAEELAAWLRSWAGAGSLTLPAAVLADSDWKRGQTLLTLGLRSQALAALDRVQQRQKSNPWTLVALALAFRDAGAHRLSLLSAEAAAGLWKGGAMNSAPAALQRLAYPFPYADLIRQEARKANVDPRLLASMIRQESRFETSATSYAGAQGLMQVMPATAKGIASRLGWRDFEPQQTYWPYINVALGADYIGTWLANFDGSLVAALAAYNGGPGNAANWRKWAPGDDDLMVALIDFNETRLYAQTVYAQYDTYKRLYPSNP
jgi:peptidoglycan lytic transglycosylase